MKLPGIQAPVTSVAMVPSPRAWNHSSVHPEIGASSPSLIMVVWSSEYFSASSEEKSMVTLVPSTV
ncbi:hypothetical protein [Actinomyces ruminis]|uniref:hypothetical protein n=1 Tax=Actinomyces ruminis TaxID=1937003 RepID=UPI001177B163|nr:hypothetical protein [Actinomyces ruminis]